MSKGWVMIGFLALMVGSLVAQTANQDYDVSDPTATACGESGNILDLTCIVMKALLNLGPMLAIIALVLGGIIYIYANVFVTADQRGRYHTLATSLVVGAIILLALVGGAGTIVGAGKTLIGPK
jgi:hypothetical protein